jgi:hypothetical protein
MTLPNTSARQLDENHVGRFLVVDKGEEGKLVARIEDITHAYTRSPRTVVKVQFDRQLLEFTFRPDEGVAVVLHPFELNNK